jgi:hypothetical protein
MRCNDETRKNNHPVILNLSWIIRSSQKRGSAHLDEFRALPSTLAKIRCFRICQWQKHTTTYTILNDRIVSGSDHKNIEYLLSFTSPYRRQMLKRVQHDRTVMDGF